MNDIHMLIQLEYLGLGLIPPFLDMNEAFLSLDAQETLKTKRKFRKVFRKFIKSNLHSYSKHTVLAMFGYPGVPSRSQKLNRQEFVYGIISRKVNRLTRKSGSSGLFF